MKKLLTILMILSSPIASASNWIQVNDWAVALKIDTQALEDKLWTYIENNSQQKFQLQDSYTYQYKTINSSELYINALCNTERTNDLSQNFVMVFDGGSCYFQATYNFKTNTFVKLEVNGEA